MARCPYRAGTRVRFTANAAALAFYSSHPVIGEEGTVTPVSLGVKKAVCLPGPRGGLVYVEWDKSGFEGVFATDVERADGKGRRRARGTGGLSGSPDTSAYKYYSVVTKRGSGSLIIGGWEFKDDATDDVMDWREVAKEQNRGDLKFRVFTRSHLVRVEGLDPKDASSWKGGSALSGRRRR